MPGYDLLTTLCVKGHSQNTTKDNDSTKAIGRSWFCWTVSILSATKNGLFNLILWPCCNLKNSCIKAYTNLSSDSNPTTKKANQVGLNTFSSVSEIVSEEAQPLHVQTSITQEAIIAHRESKEVQYGDLEDGTNKPLPNDLNRQGAIRALSAYLSCFGLKIEENEHNQSSLTQDSSGPKFTLTEDELTLINSQISSVLNGTVKENELTSIIHKAFKSVIEKRADSKSISSKIATIRGEEIPTTICNRIEIKAEGTSPEIVINEKLTASKESKWAKQYCSDNKVATKPVAQTRLSSDRENSDLQSTATNTFNHEVTVTKNDNSIKKEFVRGGAPCSHTKPATEKLIKQAEKILKLKNTDHLSTYTRVEIILDSKDTSLQELQAQLRERLDHSTSQMAARLELAYASNSQGGKGAFNHGETSLVSPGNAKERSMVLDSEMAMENLTQNYQIDETDPDNTSLVKKTNENTHNPKMRNINIVLTQMALNENQFTTSRVQENINLRAVESLRKIAVSNGSLSKEDRSKVFLLLNEIETRTLDPNRLFSDEKIVHNFNQVFEILGMTQGFFCKSGKDRTAQGVIDGIVEKITIDQLDSSAPPMLSENPITQAILSKLYTLYDFVYPVLGRVKGKVKTALQERGVSFLLTGANTLKANAYALSPLQQAVMPRFAQTPWRLCGKVNS